jgi:hypothetical protein
VKKTSSPCKTACWQVKRKQKTTCQCKHFVPPWWGWFLIWWTQTIRRDPYQWNCFVIFLVPFFVDGLYGKSMQILSQHISK